MRCKNCKSIIENENLYRCPHCGKAIPKKKKIDKSELVSAGTFFAVSFVFIVLNFFGLFFTCNQYDSATIAVTIVVYLVSVPFIFGNYKGLSRSAVDCVGIVLSIPFIVNWAVCFAAYPEYFAINTFSTVYYFSVIASILLIDTVVLLKILGVFRDGKIAKWICLAIGAAEAAFTAAFHAYMHGYKVIAVIILAFNAFMPGFITYHILSRDGKSELD